MQKFYMSVINMVYCTNDCGVISVPQMINIQCMTDLFDTVFHIQAAGAVRIGLVSDGKADLVCDVFNKAGWIVVDGGVKPHTT